MAAVASVIRNRLAAGGYGKTPTDIVRASNQFEPWNAGSGNDPRRLGSLRAGLWLLALSQEKASQRLP
jgi:spore germination cell wall hydrolase CwlJ-like protein